MKTTKIYDITTKIHYSKHDIKELKKTRNAFVGNLKEAKEKLKLKPEDYDALVDVNFYRLTIRKLNRLISKLQKNPVLISNKVIKKTFKGGNFDDEINNM